VLKVSSHEMVVLGMYAVSSCLFLGPPGDEVGSRPWEKPPPTRRGRRDGQLAQKDRVAHASRFQLQDGISKARGTR
jgi:hypothetical protein